MGTRNLKAPAGQGAVPGKPAGVKSATDALRQEAERSWADADRKAARGRRRTQARGKRLDKARQRDAEIQRLQGKLEQARRPARKKPK
jgi:hypothetical protein